MRLLVLAIIVLGGAIWLNHDRDAARVLAHEIQAAKQSTLAGACPPSNGSSFCRIMVALLYDSDR